jgi:hypothetical protein
MNISLICNKKSYNFVLPLEASLSYIKKLSCKLYKCELLDIYYKGDKITKEENEEKILKNIITDGDSNIKLKIVINPTLSSTKNQTSSNTNSPANFNKNTDNIGNNIITNSDKILLFKNKTNKLFETIYEQKIKKLFNSIRDFNKKIIEINNFLFKKKPKYGKNEHLPNFEKKVYDFIDGLRLYFMKLITTLEMNDYAKYNYIVDNLNVFYNELIYYDQLEQNSHKINTITSTPVNKFPINLKKSDNNFNLNSDKGNYFNKSSIKPSIKKVLLLHNNNNKNYLEAKSLLINDKYNIKTENNKNEKSKFIKFANDECNKNEKQLKKEDKDEDNDDNNSEKSKEDSIDQRKDISKKSKKNKNNNELDLNSYKKSQSNLSQKSINNISSITKKTVDSNKNLEKEEDNDNNKNNNSFHSQNSVKSDNAKNKQVVPFNFELIKNKNVQNENINLYEEIKLPKNVAYNNPKKNLKNENLNSTIQEMENENITNSSCDNSIGNKKKQNNTRKNSKRNSIKRNSLKKNSINDSKKNVVKVNNNKEDKINTNSNKNIAKLFRELSSTNNNNNNIRNNSNKTRQSMRINPIKSLSLERNSVANLDRRKSLLNAIPIYHISSNNENDMAKALSRKAIMKKKKNKTMNKYDFLI